VKSTSFLCISRPSTTKEYLLSKIVVLAFLSLIASVAFSAESLDGYDTMDMNQFKDLATAAAHSGVKFKTSCTTSSGEIIAATDSRFSDCMNHSVIEMKQKKAGNQNQGAGVGISTEL
jgi:hypothetical protein